MNSLFQNLLDDVPASIVASIVTAAGIWLYNWCRNLRLQRLLGVRFNRIKRVSFVYARTLQAKDGNSNTQRQETPIEKRGKEHFTVSECEVRSTNFMSTLLGAVGRIDAQMKSHEDELEKLDSTFISFGGSSTNWRTKQILNAPENVFTYRGENSYRSQSQPPIRMNRDDFTFVTGEPFHIDTQYDYGLILRITPVGHPNNAWLVCAGIGEWGTSGASWYLAKRWETLIQKLDTHKWKIGIPNIPDFAVVVKVERGRDESAHVIKAFSKQNGRAVEIDVFQE